MRHVVNIAEVIKKIHLRRHAVVSCCRSYCPLLAVYYLNAVTRRDDAKCFGFDEFLKVLLKQQCRPKHV